ARTPRRLSSSGFNVAATWVSRKMLGTSAGRITIRLLQCGRDMGVAEDLVQAYTASKAVAASMWPRHGGRGRSPPTRSNVGGGRRFNVAATWVSRKMRQS